jgi:hypothetical protein
MSAVPELALEFEFHYHFVRWDESRADDLTKQANDADVWLIQEVSDWDSYPLRHVQKEGAVKIKFPFLFIAALWPFDAYQNGPDLVALEKGTKLSPEESFPFQDSLLARLRIQEPDPTVRHQIYCDLCLDETPDFCRYWELDAMRLKQMDMRLGIELGAQMISDFRTKRLFHTINHPTIEMLQRLADVVLRPLGRMVDWSAIDVFDRLSVFQVPVHPTVAKALDLTWANESTLYTFHAKEHLTFEQYIWRYIQLYG